MPTRIPLTLFLVFIFSTLVNLVQAQNSWTKQVEGNRYLRVMFYNCENFFDTIADPDGKDKEYIIGGVRNWNSFKFNNKANKISQVITNLGGWTPVEIIGLCEVESKLALDKLVYNTPLYKYEYRYLHKESPDHRGIDVALLYQVNHYQPIYTDYILVVDSTLGLLNTREILYSKGLTKDSDTLHIFVNHWPSRWGGQLESEPKRIFAANTLRKKVDSINLANPKAQIIIMGDFNDEPNNKSMEETLLKNNNYLLNPAKSIVLNNNAGTHKYQGQWSILDQIIISKSLFHSSSELRLSDSEFKIFSAPFLLTPDETYLGKKPFRTYHGYKYMGGYSDHLPVFIDLIRE